MIRFDEYAETFDIAVKVAKLLTCGVKTTRITRNGQAIFANRSQAEAIASCSASSCRCRGTDVGARSFQYGAEARSASVQQ